MKGILMAGGLGTRLFPLSHAVTKHLLPVYDKPLIYYPLSTLMLSGVREVCVIVSPRDASLVQSVLRDGSHLGMRISLVEQEHPRGVVDGFRLAEPLLRSGPICMVLGDNILHGAKLGMSLSDLSSTNHATIFSYRVADPSTYGVIELSDDGQPLSLEEKPVKPRSNLAVPGLYFYPSDVFQVAAQIWADESTDLHIGKVNNAYLNLGRLDVIELPLGTAWMDCGTVDSLFEASTYVEVLTRRQGAKIACPEEIAWRHGWISDAELEDLAAAGSASGYGGYLRGLLAAGRIKDFEI